MSDEEKSEPEESDAVDESSEIDEIDEESDASEEFKNPLEADDGPALSERLGAIGVVDHWIYRVETVVVVTFLILMSILVFTDVVYQLSVTLSQYFDAGDSNGYSLSGVLAAFVGAMGWAASKKKDRPAGMRAGIALGWIAGSALFAYLLLVLESSTVYRLVLVAFAIPIALKFKELGESKRLGVFIVSAVIAFIVFGNLPTGFSWAQSYSLLMLLWVGFLGASMAARERRHLRVDLARKTLPPEKLPWFNTASYLAAAAFSAVVLYLSFEYIFGFQSSYIKPIWEVPSWMPAGMKDELINGYPLPEDASAFRRALQVFFAPSEPGEIPDWLKVLAIPVSFLLITLRFIGHAVVFARMGIAGESYSEVAGGH